MSQTGSDKQVLLGTAAFLDSPEARALAAPGRADLRRVVEAFLTVCYDELGVKPRLLDGEAMTSALAEGLPGRLKAKDPVAEHVPAVLEAFLAHLEATEIVPHAFEARHALDERAAAFVEVVRSGDNAALARKPKHRSNAHVAPKLGRNDPCSCGSGKKYKKCHGKRD